MSLESGVRRERPIVGTRSRIGRSGGWWGWWRPERSAPRRLPAVSRHHSPDGALHVDDEPRDCLPASTQVELTTSGKLHLAIRRYARVCDGGLYLLSILTVGHKLRSTPTNGHRFTACGLPWWSPIQVLAAVDVP